MTEFLVETVKEVDEFLDSIPKNILVSQVAKFRQTRYLVFSTSKPKEISEILWELQKDGKIVRYGLNTTVSVAKEQ